MEEIKEVKYKEGIVKAISPFERHNSFCFQDNEKEWFKMQDIPIEKEIQRGWKIKLFYKDEGNQKTINKIEVLEKNERKQNNWEEDIISFEELLAKAHEIGIMDIRTNVEYADFEKKFACFKARVLMKNGTSFTAHGDATQENCQSETIKPHFYRMAETRAIARALRFATNNGTVADVEIK